MLDECLLYFISLKPIRYSLSLCNKYIFHNYHFCSFQWYFFLGNLTFSLAAGVVIALVFYLPFVNLEAAFFYIKNKGAAMMFGRHPYEGVELDISEMNNFNPPPKNVESYNNYGLDMDNRSNYYSTLKTNRDPTEYYNSVGTIVDSKQIEVTEL